MVANDHCKDIEAQKEAKGDMLLATLKRIQDKESERDSFEVQISAIDVTGIDDRERNLQIEVERRASQLAAKDFTATIRKKQGEVFTLEQEIKDLNYQRESMSADSHDRVVLSLKKAEMENHKKKHKRIVDEYKERIRVVLKGRMPPHKDLKNELVQVQSSLQKEYDNLDKKADEARNELTMLKIKIEEVNHNLSKFHKDMESRKRFVESKLLSLDKNSGGVDSYLQTLEVAKDKRDVQKSKYNIADGIRQTFDPFEKVARAHHICPCCERQFSANEEDDFVKSKE
ncbi:hypothetical protein F511_43296 [Dorcoceras hygrometricum]|uniref:Zinc-hook domain-containing protein n=1 Tax=Dorcoceras hygrometricum TaxID=472368 RepID=A0A2Z6ZYJ4_9LAMI|nr:hypothetical protein F511_44865 [Dorcoceras hygrometricum]KZV15574.1 hypothetical protein F511_43296 [Dorcoceras hygrometricum]